MKKKITTLFLLALGATTYAQVTPPDPIGMGVGTALVPNKSAILDVAAKNKGVLIPRVALDNVKVFGLEGGSGTESMLVYNSTGTLAKGFYYWTKNAAPGEDKWELITSESVLNQKIEDLKTYVDNEIKKITNITDGANLSYLVAFNPKGGKNGNGSFSYLVPDGNGGYTQTALTFEELIALSETKTFIKAEMHEIDNPNDKTTKVTVVKAYWYFNEEAVNTWMKTDGNKIEDIPFAAPGFKIDVVGTVSSNLEQVFNDNRKFIDKFITKSNGNVYVKVDNNGVTNMYYTNEAGDEVLIDFNSIETKTTIQKTTIKADGTEGAYADSELGTPKAGQIVFKYKSEAKDALGNPVNFFLNITEEVKTAITHEDVKNELKKYLTEGGNVYFGDHDGDAKTPDLLYRVEEDKKNPGTFINVPIDISASVIEVITNNEKVTEVIKEKLKEVVEKNTTTETGEVIGKYKVFKTIVTVTVANGTTSDGAVVEYNTQFSEAIKLEKFSRLLNVEILDENGQVVLTTITDVKTGTVANDKTPVEFRFGVGKMYAPLAAKNYDVILRYISTEEFVPKFPATKP
ncbi:hypothetical protein [Myroides sp. N17-2]|uniref:hypothetical protein n=1 Tax=Myroides sp. N17-2 TaxID=2030799 RepID=UPI000EFDAF48|nr:hypothetical protein [Myroides sp. N17-2]